jgi:hypothetical protein
MAQEMHLIFGRHICLANSLVPGVALPQDRASWVPGLAIVAMLE